jgi:hypothetical protein
VPGACGSAGELLSVAARQLRARRRSPRAGACQPCPHSWRPFIRPAWAVGHDAVHAELEQVVHQRLVVDCPDVNRETRAMGGLHEPNGDDRDRPSPERDLDAVCLLARDPATDCRDAGDGHGGRSHRRAGPAAAELAEAAKAAIGEGAEADPMPCAEPVDDRDEGPDAHRSGGSRPAAGSASSPSRPLAALRMGS